MSAARIKKGDRVVVLSGKDKGKIGEVTRAMPKDGKVIVAGVNVATRHRKPSQANPQGGLERVEAPLHISKVAMATATSTPPRERLATSAAASPRPKNAKSSPGLDLRICRVAR